MFLSLPLPPDLLGSQDLKPVSGKMRGEEKGEEEEGDEKREKNVISPGICS